MTTTTKTRIRRLHDKIEQAKRAASDIEQELYTQRDAAPEYLPARLCAAQAWELLNTAQDYMRTAAIRQINNDATSEG